MLTVATSITPSTTIELTVRQMTANGYPFTTSLSELQSLLKHCVLQKTQKLQMLPTTSLIYGLDLWCKLTIYKTRNAYNAIRYFHWIFPTREISNSRTESHKIISQKYLHFNFFLYKNLSLAIKNKSLIIPDETLFLTHFILYFSLSKTPKYLLFFYASIS